MPTKDETSAYNRRHYLKHREALRARARDYYRANREALAAKYLTHRIEKLEKMRADRDGPRGALLQAMARARYAKNPAPAIARANKRRALKFKAGIGTDRAAYIARVQEIRSRQTCHWCGSYARSIQVDHIVPLARGGPDSAENLCGACRRCNLSRGDRMPETWPYRPHFPSILTRNVG